MSQGQRSKIQNLLSAEQSAMRAELLSLGFDALASAPLGSLTTTGELAALVYEAIVADNVARISKRHVVPGIKRVTAGFTGQADTIHDALSDSGAQQLRAIVASGKGPRFGWLTGAIDPDDFRQLIAPVLQQMLLQFAGKLPIPGVSSGGSGGGSGGSSGLGSLVGKLGKTVQKSAGQLADVGKSMMSGLGGELERRMQSIAKDFSQTATTEFRTALIERMKSPEGQVIVERIRERVLERVLKAKLDDVVRDFMHLPVDDIDALVTTTMDNLRHRPLFKQLVEAEMQVVLTDLEAMSLADVLKEAGLLDNAKLLATRAVEPGITKLVASDAFGDWLERLLAQTADG